MNGTPLDRAVEETIRTRWPQMRENLLMMAELDQRMRDAGMPTPPMPWILQEAIRIAKAQRP